MPIPDYQSVMLPLLRFAADRKEHSLKETIEGLAKIFELSEEERIEKLPSGQTYVFNNRVGWARTYLKKAGLLEDTKRAHFVITERGVNLLGENLDRIDVSILERYEKFREFKNVSRHASKREVNEIGEKTPSEMLEQAYQTLREELSQDLINQIMNCTSEFFEKLVVELLVKMGYGGSLRDAGQAVGRSHDEGIDGIIKEDKLGLDVIYIQAKRWQGVVGRPDIQKFVGALQGQRANKGIFITTSSFTREAVEYITSILTRIILIDGKQLAELMIDYDIGVSTVSTYMVKRVDSDYFTPE